MPFEDYLRAAALAASWFAELAGVVVVVLAAVRAAWRYVVDLYRRASPFPRTQIRLDMGRSLALALEFLLAADIVQTAVAPSWEEIGKLGAIAAIRTGLNFFLEREIERESRQVEGPEAGPTRPNEGEDGRGSG